MRLIQFRGPHNDRHVGLVSEDGGHVEVLSGFDGTYRLAQAAVAEQRPLAQVVAESRSGRREDYGTLLEDDRVLAPIDHPDPAHLWITGTGLSHLGSADARDKMHAAAQADAASLTDSMRMFRDGLAGGKPGPGKVGAQPEWFYKGDGTSVAGPGQPLEMPDFALDGGEEPEICGVYLIAPDGAPWRVGFALANEFSDHVLERQNYLLLAHSKLRPFAFGPELLLGELPADVRGQSRIRRGDAVVWEGEFLSGEDNMSHSIANLEHHHFKYRLFRQPGDVHVHVFGTATLSFAAGVRVEPGDVFEIEAPAFGRPLRNPLARAEGAAVPVRAL